jgi:4-hydroxybenzoate polyprenyltransferase
MDQGRLMKFSKPFGIIGIVFGFLMFIGIAIMTNLFSEGDLPILISGALLQAVITAIITYCLLSGQTDSEEKREKNVKTFERKLGIYSEFIETMWKMFDDGVVEISELKYLRKH